MSFIIKKLSAILVLLVLVMGCTNKITSGPNYYLLNSIDLNAQAFELKPSTLAIGPITIPTYLNREGIAVYDGLNQLNYSDNHRWAQALSENLSKVFLTNLQQLLPGQKLIAFPFRQSSRPDYQISMNVENFGYVNDQTVKLQARAVIYNKAGKQIEAVNFTMLRKGIAKEYPEIVKTMSELLSEMTVQLTEKLAEIL